jgi:hypothetical protein
LAMLDPPNGFRLGIIRLSARGAFPVRLREMISTADWGGTPLPPFFRKVLKNKDLFVKYSGIMT